MKNRKGFTGIEIVIIIAVCGIIGYFAAPKVGEGIHNIVNGGQNQKKATISRQVERTYYVPDEQHPGKFIKDHTDVSKETSFASDSSQPPETLWEKFWHLGFIAVVIIALIAGAITYFGAWPFVKNWINKLKADIAAKEAALQAEQNAHADLSTDAKLIVKSVDAGFAEMDKHIAAVKAQVDSATLSLNQAGLLVDPIQRAAAITLAQNNLTIAQEVYKSVVNMEQDFKDALSMSQDTSTKMLVSTLQNQ